MSVVDKAALALTQCWKCLGCDRLENESFRGDNECKGFKTADAVTLVQRRYENETIEGTQDTWRLK